MASGSRSRLSTPHLPHCQRAVPPPPIPSANSVLPSRRSNLLEGWIDCEGAKWGPRPARIRREDADELFSGLSTNLAIPLVRLERRGGGRLLRFCFSKFPQTWSDAQQRRHPSGPAGSVLTVSFELDGVKFTALNGGSDHKFNDAVSFVVRCETQDEIDYYWSALTEGGSEIACGWLKDRFGLCWQIVPAQILELIRHPKVMEAMMKMTKFDIAALQRRRVCNQRLRVNLGACCAY